jgi:hypothetical protein
MIKHAIRIATPWLRVPLVTLLFPFFWLGFVVVSALPARMGGHPHKERFLTLDFWTLPLALYLAAVDGDFVPDPHRSPNQERK